MSLNTSSTRPRRSIVNAIFIYSLCALATTIWVEMKAKHPIVWIAALHGFDSNRRGHRWRVPQQQTIGRTLAHAARRSHRRTWQRQVYSAQRCSRRTALSFSPLTMGRADKAIRFFFCLYLVPVNCYRTIGRGPKELARNFRKYAIFECILSIYFWQNWGGGGRSPLPTGMAPVLVT